ncbi:MAG: FAD-binding oxidoreductase [Gammaproteobacteria bacterium]|nr:FAD-binding oxidoreductase [Gammaproteobacteria bacterium]
MPQLQFREKFYTTEGEESVLDCLLRHGVEVPHSCKKGTCHTCTLKVTEGVVPEESQRGLKDTEKAQGLFLSCSCRPSADMTVLLPDVSGQQHTVSVLQKDHIADDVIRLRLDVPDGFSYRPGQFINLYKTPVITRSYSLASMGDSEAFLELHIKHVKGGQVSDWLAQDLKPGDEIVIGDALGSSFYLAEKLDQNLLLVGTGTGLSPLYGIARSAVASGHTGQIKLFHGSRTRNGLYLDRELRKFADDVSNFEYTACVSGESNLPVGFHEGRANDLALKENKDLKNWRVFLCGHPDMVEKTKLKSYLAGASLYDIHADPFIPAT